MRTLIVGFGNVLLGDDGFGVEVVNRLASTELPTHVEMMEVGIGGMHLVLKLTEDFDEVIVVDAVRRGQPPGTLYIFTPGQADLDIPAGDRIDPHFAEPARAMKLAWELGFLPEKVTLVGCEPESCSLGTGLTIAVTGAVGRAVENIRGMVCETRDARRAAG